MPYPFAEAQALAERARLMAEHMSRDQARDSVGEALAIFRELGAQPFVERAERALAELG
jgi:hypothetical protein